MVLDLEGIEASNQWLIKSSCAYGSLSVWCAVCTDTSESKWKDNFNIVDDYWYHRRTKCVAKLHSTRRNPNRVGVRLTGISASTWSRSLFFFFWSTTSIFKKFAILAYQCKELCSHGRAGRGAPRACRTSIPWTLTRHRVDSRFSEQTDSNPRR